MSKSLDAKDIQHIIVIQGASNRGKTTLIKQYCEELKELGAQEIFYKQAGQNDCVALLKWDNSHIGFISRGDCERRLREDWKAFWKESQAKNISSVNVLIGACRTKGETVDFWKQKGAEEPFFKMEKSVSHKVEAYLADQPERLRKKVRNLGNNIHC